MGDGCQTFKWRPRPPSTLTQKQIKNIKANMSQYAKAFQEKDHLRSTQVGQKERYAKMAEEQARYEREIYGELDGDDDWEEVQVNVMLSTKVETKGRSE